MKDYTSYSEEDFLDDEHFRCWVLEPTAEVSDFWESWLAANPQHADTVYQARTLLLAVEKSFGIVTNISERDIEAEVDKMTGSLDRAQEPLQKLSEENYWKLWGRLAAIFLAVVGVGWYLFLNHDIEPASNVKVSSTAVALLRTETNNADRPKTVFLSDGSVAMLEKGSSIRFPDHFENDRRLVYLTGEAFFDVAKNPEKPFLVYAGATVTRVIGTSFRIKAWENETNITVAVRTGKVAVYERNDFETGKNTNSASGPGLELIPDEQAIFSRQAATLEKEQVQDPQLVASKPDREELAFDDMPLPKVLLALSLSYGIDINFDQKAFASCRISTQFEEESLRQRLEVICEAIDAGYTIKDNKVTITGSGCRQ